MKYKVGDKVRIISDACDEGWEHKYLNKTGEIVGINPDSESGPKYIYLVNVPQENGNDTIWAEDELELL